MSQLRKILGTSILSLILVIWGLFMVCSGRVPTVNSEDDLMSSEEYVDDEYKSNLVKQLTSLEETSTQLEDYQRREILEALGIEPSEEYSSKKEEGFLTEELFLDLEVEISELEELSKRKSRQIDSLKLELEELDHQLIALNNLVKEPESVQKTSRMVTTSLNKAYGYGYQYSISYQDALNDVYAHNYSQAIKKFRQLLKKNTADDLSDNCQYWIGECYYAMGKYELAIVEFEKVFAFDNNNKADDAQFMIGLAYIKIGEPYLAQLELNNLLEFYDNSEYVAKAERRLTELNI